jgi:hypothetical protein
MITDKNLFLYPNEGNEKVAIAARGARNQPARKQMLAPAEGTPE